MEMAVGAREFFTFSILSASLSQAPPLQSEPHSCWASVADWSLLPQCRVGRVEVLVGPERKMRRQAQPLPHGVSLTP